MVGLLGVSCFSFVAKALQVTAQAVEASTDKQQLIMQQLQDKATN